MAKQLDSSEYSRNNVERYHKRAAGKGIRKGIVAFIVVALLAALGGTAFAAVNWVKSLDERLHNEEVVDDELRAVLTEPAAPSDPYAPTRSSSCASTRPTSASPCSPSRATPTSTTRAPK